MNYRISHKSTTQKLCRTLLLGVLAAFQSLAQTSIGARACSGEDCAGSIEAIKISEHPKGISNGINTVYTLSHVPLSELPMYLSRNGIKLTTQKDFRAVRNQISLAIPPDPGDTLTISYYSLPALVQRTGSRHKMSQTRGSDGSVVSFSESAVREAVLAEADASWRVPSNDLKRPNVEQNEEQLPRGVGQLLERTKQPSRKTTEKRKDRSPLQGLEGVGETPIRSTLAKSNATSNFENDTLLQALKRAIESNTASVVHH